MDRLWMNASRISDEYEKRIEEVQVFNNPEPLSEKRIEEVRVNWARYFLEIKNRPSDSNPIKLRQDTSIALNMKYFEWCCLCSLITLLSSPSSSHGSMINEKVLHVGEELFKETLPLQNGACLYQLRGLRPHMWYEVKISYPASIPARFSLQLSKGTSDLGLNQGRKLLNTEKLIFKSDRVLSLIEHGGVYVLVNVEPEGVVAIPGKHETEYVMFNIVCDELLLGIPHKAWYIAVLVLVCLVFAFVVPSFLPPFLLPKNGNQPLHDRIVTKDS